MEMKNVVSGSGNTEYRRYKGVRCSNMELLRLIAMLLVVVVHTNFHTLGMPSAVEVDSSPFSSFTRFVVQSASIVCVDVFVLISGWFGIHPNKRSVFGFLFQCAFFIWGIYLFSVLFRVREFSFEGIADCLLLTDNGWFIKAYLGLYLLSPALNAFVDNSSKRSLLWVVVLFYFYQSVYGWFSHGLADVQRGYSVFSFIGLYLLSRYIRLYRPALFDMKARYNLLVYAVITFLCALTACFVIWLDVRGVSAIANMLYSYVALPVVLSAVFLLLFFSRLKIQSRIINNMAMSCFSVYLLHTDDAVFPFIVQGVRDAFNACDAVGFMLYMLALYLLIFVVAISLDRVRLFLWRYVVGRFFLIPSV